MIWDNESVFQRKLLMLFFASIVSHISQNGTQKVTTIGARKQKKRDVVIAAIVLFWSRVGKKQLHSGWKRAEKKNNISLVAHGLTYYTYMISISSPPMKHIK